MILIIIVAVFMILLATLILMMSVQSKERENYLREVCLYSTEKFYYALQNKMETVRCYRHDLANHIQTLEWLMEKEENQEGTYKAIKSCQDNLKEKYLELKSVIYSDDELLNTFFSLKKQICDEKEIKTRIEITEGSYEEIKKVDLIGLLHNLWDNAIEACEKIVDSEDRQISFYMGKCENKIEICIQNSIIKNEKVQFSTAKREKTLHGIGLLVIRTLVEKYNGSIGIKTNEKDGNIVFDIELLTNTMS